MKGRRGLASKVGVRRGAQEHIQPGGGEIDGAGGWGYPGGES